MGEYKINGLYGGGSIYAISQRYPAERRMPLACLFCLEDIRWTRCTKVSCTYEPTYIRLIMFRAVVSRPLGPGKIEWATLSEHSSLVISCLVSSLPRPLCMFPEITLTMACFKLPPALPPIIGISGKCLFLMRSSPSRPGAINGFWKLNPPALDATVSYQGKLLELGSNVSPAGWAVLVRSLGFVYIELSGYGGGKG